jgi:hypothetical protein
MSCVCILTPIVIAAWPAFSAAVAAAATSLGYSVVENQMAQGQVEDLVQGTNKIELNLANSELVTGQLGRDQKISVTRSGVTVTFTRDIRGHASICVSGEGHSEEALRALGEELSNKVVQQYVYQKLMDEFRTRQFMVVEETTEENQAIRLKVRHWEN